MSVLQSRFNKVTRQKPLTLLKQAFNIFLLFSRVSSLYKTCGAFLYSLSKPVTYRSSKKQFLRKPSRNEAQEKFLLEKFQAQKKLPRCGKLPKFYALAWVRLKLCGNLFTKFPLQEIRANYGILRSVCYSGLFHFANQMPKFIFRIMIEAQ